MKELLEQGALAASKAGEKAQDWGEKGYQASKEWVSRAGAKAQELGEIGIIKLEIRQLEGQAQKFISRLGTEAYQAFAERGEDRLTVESPGIKPLLAEIARIREEIEKREADLRGRKS
jgi:hypothetical protein